MKRSQMSMRRSEDELHIYAWRRQVTSLKVNWEYLKDQSCWLVYEAIALYDLQQGCPDIPE